MRFNFSKLLVFVGFVVLLGFGLSGCKSRKDITKAEDRVLTEVVPQKRVLTEEELLVSFVHGISPVFSSYGAKLDVEYGGMSYSGTLRLIRDSVIWISVGKFGFEGARLMLKRDNVLFLNKINREYFVGGYDFLYGLMGFRVNFDMVQALLLGEDFSDFDTTGFRIEPKGDVVNIIFNSRMNLKDSNRFAKLNQQLFFNKKLKWIERNYVEVVGSKNKLDVYYSSYLPLGGYNFPKNMNIVAFSGKTLKATIRFEKQKLNEKFDFPFSIPKGYDLIK